MLVAYVAGSCAPLSEATGHEAALVPGLQWANGMETWLSYLSSFRLYQTTERWQQELHKPSENSFPDSAKPVGERETDDDEDDNDVTVCFLQKQDKVLEMVDSFLQSSISLTASAFQHLLKMPSLSAIQVSLLVLKLSGCSALDKTFSYWTATICQTAVLRGFSCVKLTSASAVVNTILERIGGGNFRSSG